MQEDASRGKVRPRERENEFVSSSPRRLKRSLALICLGLSARAAFAQSFQTSAPFALVEDYESGAVLFDKNADEPMAPASTTKMLTAEIVFHELKEGRLHLDDKFQVSENAWRTGGAHSHGSAMFLDVHSQVRVEDLHPRPRHPIRQRRGDHAGRGHLPAPRTISPTLMNKRAAELGMTHSHFTNPWGRGDPGQRVTARDMALLAAHIIRELSRLLQLFRREGIHLEQDPPAQPQPAADDGYRRRRPEDRRHRRERLRTGRFGGPERAAADRRDQRPEDRAANAPRKRANCSTGASARSTRAFCSSPATSSERPRSMAAREGEVPRDAASSRPRCSSPRGGGERLTAKIVYIGPLVAPVSEGVEVGRLKVWRGTDARARSAGQDLGRGARGRPGAARARRGARARAELACADAWRRNDGGCARRGRFITLEGGEGAGKSVQARDSRAAPGSARARRSR